MGSDAFLTLFYHKMLKCPILPAYLTSDYFDCLTHETGAPLHVQKCPNIRPPPCLTATDPSSLCAFVAAFMRFLYKKGL